MQNTQNKPNDFNLEQAIHLIGEVLKEIKFEKNQEGQLSLGFDIGGTHLTLQASSDSNYSFEAKLEAFQFGQLISNLTEGIQTVAIFTVLQKIELKTIKFKFKNLTSFIVTAQSQIGTCEIGITDKKFTCSISPPQNFSFKSICQQIGCLDALGLNKLKFEVSSQEFKIDGNFAINQIKPLADLVQTLFPGLSESLILRFSVIIKNWKEVAVRMDFLKELKVNNAVIVNELYLELIFYQNNPFFLISGDISVKICDHDFHLKTFFPVGVAPKLVARMDGIWNEPFGLKDSHLKNLQVEITSKQFSAAGQIKLGEMKARASVLYDYQNPSKSMFSFTMRQFRLGKVLSVFRVDISPENAKVLDEIHIHEISINMAPPGGITIGDRSHEQGFSAKLDCQIFGFKANLSLKYKDNALKLFGQMDQIELGDFFILKGAKQRNGPSFDVQASLSQTSRLNIHGFVVILDKIEREVYAEVSLQGINFKTKGPLKIFNWNFVEDSFLLRTGFLNIYDNLVVQANFQVDSSTFQIIEKEFKEAANKIIKIAQYQQAKVTLGQAHALLNEKQKIFDSQCQKLKNYLEKKLFKYNQAYQKSKSDALTALRAAKKKAQQTLNQQIKTAHLKMQDDKHRAKVNYDKDLIKGSQQLNQKKVDADNQLKIYTNRVQETNQHQQKILREIRERENLPPLQQMKEDNKLTLAKLLTQKQKAKQGKEAARQDLTAQMQKYDKEISTAHYIYTEISSLYKRIYDQTISSAEQTHENTLKAAQYAYNQQIKAAQATFEELIRDTKDAGKKVTQEQRALIDETFNAARQDLNKASISVKIAEQALSWMQKEANCVLSFLDHLSSKGISAILIIKQLLFEFDIIKGSITTRIGLTILEKELNTQMDFRITQIDNFLVLLANRIWSFIIEQKSIQ